MTAALLAFLLLPDRAGPPAPPPSAPAPSAADVQFFEKSVRPLLVSRCQSCHSAGKKKRGGLLLDSGPALLRGGDSGPAVVPGEPDKSLLLKAVRHQHPTLRMPPSGKLPDREVALLEEWVRRGAPFPGSERPGPGGGIDIAAGRKFWSFQPLKRHDAPPLRHPSWPRRSIDSFILSRLEKDGLSPAPEASRRTLIRRVCFDLVGLPPPPEDVEAFVKDSSPDAYEKLVERLLASPAHGERWARFWLDLVRYCDVAEAWAEGKGAPHLYRDWVVQAFNSDLPYDQFVQRQLAADLLPDTTPADRAALGFLALSPTYWKELKLDHTVIQGVVAEEWEERIHTLGSTVLGLTVACARCHDHKFDPISQKDYYALAGVFASIRPVDRPLLPDDMAREAQKAHDRVRALEEQLKKLRARKPADESAREERRKLEEEIAHLKKTPGFAAPLAQVVDEASLHVMADGPHRTKLVWKPGAAQDVAVQVRGNPASPGPVVPRRFLAVLSPAEPRPFTQGSGRRELARALFQEGGALASRVMVNRLWQHHFGQALVSTPSDFGAQGARPTHLELLDDLAARFVANGWSLKWLHREIVLSATYRQAGTRRHGLKDTTDPDNLLLGRMSRRRLEVEAWRDSMLAVAGNLSSELGGVARDLAEPTNTRRTLYGTVKRRELNDLLRLYDVPDATTHSPARVPSTTPLQQLFVLNSPFFKQQSALLARRLEAEVPASEDGRIDRAYHLLFGRPPREGEKALARAFLAAEGGGHTAWERYAHVLLGSNEFLYVD